jgi:hypothetical protein
MTRSARDSRQAGFEGPFKCIFKGILKSAKTHDRAFEWSAHLGLADRAAQILF